MGIKATILEVSGDPQYQYEEYKQFLFSLADSDEEGMVCFVSTMSESHATFLVEHTSIGSNSKSAYNKMVQAIAITDSEGARDLVGREFDDEE